MSLLAQGTERAVVGAGSVVDAAAAAADVEVAGNWELHLYAGGIVTAVEKLAAVVAEVASEVAEYAQPQETSDAGSTHSPPV